MAAPSDAPGALSPLPLAQVQRLCGSCAQFSPFIDDEGSGVCQNGGHKKRQVKCGDRCHYRVPQWTPKSIMQRTSAMVQGVGEILVADISKAQERGIQEAREVAEAI